MRSRLIRCSSLGVAVQKSGEKKRRFKNVLKMKKEFDKRITILFKKKEKEDE